MATPSERPGAGSPTLGRSIRPTGYFALVFGQMVGSGWLVMLGVWLDSAGPSGAVAGFMSGGLAMLLLSAVYCELAARMPDAGGEIVYVERAFGTHAAFLLAWFLTIYYIALSAFEGIALSWLLGEFFPELHGRTMYVVLGEPVTTDGIALGFVGVVLIGALNVRGASVSVVVQRAITYTFLGLCLLLVLAAVFRGRTANLSPLLHASTGSTWLSGAAWIFASCALFVSGFQAICYTVEERHPQTSLRSIAVAVAVAVLVGTLFYTSMILSAASARPWTELLGQRLPAVSAFNALYPGGRLGALVLVAATVSLAKTWNSLLLAASRMLFGQARLGFLPRYVAAIHPRYRSPYRAVGIVSGLSFIGILLGRGAIVPILNTGALCVCLMFVTCILVLLKIRARCAVTADFRVPGGTPVILTTLGTVVAMVVELTNRSISDSGGRIPLEVSLIVVWAVIAVLALGFRTWRTRRHPEMRHSVTRSEHGGSA